MALLDRAVEKKMNRSKSHTIVQLAMTVQILGKGHVKRS
jgi:hypothetical protein